jgi:hypothetical protein
MMKYRILCSDSDWLPNEGGGIKLWREDDEGRAVLPCGGPPALRAQSMRYLDEIVKGISIFIK